MFSRSGFIRLSTSHRAATFNRLTDVVPGPSRPLTLLSRCRPPVPGLRPPPVPGLRPPALPGLRPPALPGLRPPLPGLRPPVPGLRPPPVPGLRPPPVPGLRPPLPGLRPPALPGLRPPLPGLRPPALPGLRPPLPGLRPPALPGLRPPLPGLRPPALPGNVNVTLRFRSSSRNREMPKKEKQVKAEPAAAQTEASCPVARDRSGGVTITVHAKPGSKHSSVTEVSAEAVGVSIAAPPADGAANTELIRYLAEVLDLKKSHVSLDKGCRSRDKLIRVDSSLSPEEVLRRLRQAAG